jgi:hypothetical protein
MNLRIKAMALAAMLFGWSGAAMAFEYGVYPAIGCAKEVGSNGTLFVDAGGRIFNSDTFYTLTVDCPLVRQDVTRSWNEASVSVVDGNSNWGADVTCAFIQATFDGNTLSGASSHNTYGLPLGTSTLFYYGGPPPGDVYSYNYLRCTLPASQAGFNSGILSYRMTE